MLLIGKLCGKKILKHKMPLSPPVFFNLWQPKKTVDSAILQTKELQPVFFSLTNKIFVLYKTVISDLFQITFSNA